MFNRSLVRFALLVCAGALVSMTVLHTESGHAAETPAVNPLLQKWVGPCGRLPPFDNVKK
jgi:hypothetical protein